MPDELDALRGALPGGQVITDPDVMESYRRDQTTVISAGQPRCVVLPRTTAEVASTLAWAQQHRIPVVPRGGGTGLAGGAAAIDGCMMLSLSRMNAITEIDPANEIAVAESGVVTADLDRAAAAYGLMYPPDPSSFETSTIGGNLATNAGGLRCVKYGVTRDAALGLEVVLADGRVLHTGRRTRKGVTGYDLTGLFVGSEGTLGVITAATLRLVPKPDVVKALAYTFQDTQAAAAFLGAVVDAGFQPYHIALLDRQHFVFERALRARSPEPADLVLVTLVGAKDDVADQEKALDALAPKLAAAKRPPQEAEDLWTHRFMMYSARRMSRGLIVSNNVVPLAKLGEACRVARELIRKMKLNGAVHAFPMDTASAILAPYVLMDETTPSGGTALGYVKKMGDAAFELGGHPMGLGLFMVFNLRRMHGRAAPYTAYVKSVFDPKKKINPGKTIEVWTKYHFPGLRAVPPPAMRAGLSLAAALRRIKPTQDKFVRSYEREKGVG